MVGRSRWELARFQIDINKTGSINIAAVLEGESDRDRNKFKIFSLSNYPAIDCDGKQKGICDWGWRDQEESPPGAQLWCKCACISTVQTQLQGDEGRDKNGNIHTEMPKCRKKSRRDF